MRGISEAFVYVGQQVITTDNQFRSARAYQNDIQIQITERAFETFKTLVHELFHVAAKEGMVGHIDLDRAARSLDPSLVYKGYEENRDDAPLFEAYIRNKCTKPLR